MEMRPLPAQDLALVREHAVAPFKRLAGAHVLITGASGLVGSWMLESLLDAQRHFGLDVTVTALVRDAGLFAGRYPHLFTSPQLTLHEGDIRTFSGLARSPSHVIHAASAATPARNDEAPDDVIEMIDAGTLHLLDVARLSKSAQLLVLSSGSVYVSQPRPIKEADPVIEHATNRAERFGAAKARAERAAMQCGATVARVFTLVGPRLPLDGQFAIGQFFGDALAARSINVRGDGTPLRSYLYLADLAAWCWHLLDREGGARIYNVGATQTVAVGGVASRVASLANVPVVIAERPMPGASPTCYLPSVDRVRSELGLDAWTSLDDGLARTWAWLTGGV